MLAEAPTGRHFAQFHRDQADLVESIVTFLDAGLRRGNSILIVAAPEQVARLFERLAAGKFQPTALSDAGQLAQLDPNLIIERLQSNGTSEPTILRDAIRPVLSRLQPHGRGVRVYSELAGTLWQAGETEAAIRVEEFWNTLAESDPVSLFCGFTMDTQSEHSYQRPLEELGRTHSDILGTAEDERFGIALDRASKEMFGISLTQMASVSRQDGARRFPSGQRAMLWVTRNLPMSSGQLTERARQYFKNNTNHNNNHP